jgi:hypothetical protein
MQFERNPFERDLQNTPLMRFLIHSNSLSSEILSKDSPAHRLIKVNGFEEIEIMPLPVANNDVRKILIDNGLICSEYYSYESGVALKTSDGSINAVADEPHYDLSNLWEPVISGSGVTRADIYTSGKYDYFVVGTGDPILKYKVAKDNIITAERAIDLVRILLTAHGRFYVSPKGPSVNEWYYYLYRFKSLFKAFQYAWTAATYAHGKGLSEKLYDYLDTLGTRLEFICRAYDKVAFFSLKTPDHDNQNNQLYHLAYFVMLITGVFDVLAHIIKEFYNINVGDPQSVSLRILRRKEAINFYQILLSKNAELHTFLTAEDTQRDITAFYPIRDSLQHRELLRGIQYSNSFIDRKNVFELSNEAAETLRKISGESTYIIRWHKPCLLDPFLFITWAQKVLIGLVNGVLSSIDWDSACETLPSDIQSKIRESNQRFEQGVGKFLRWPEEPMYF